jgi:hypothetical protein
MASCRLPIVLTLQIETPRRLAESIVRSPSAYSRDWGLYGAQLEIGSCLLLKCGVFVVLVVSIVTFRLSAPSLAGKGHRQYPSNGEQGTQSKLMDLTALGVGDAW